MLGVPTERGSRMDNKIMPKPKPVNGDLNFVAKPV